VVDAKALAKAFEAVRYSKPLAMALEDGTERPVLIKELKAHPFKRAYVHVDFWGIDLEKTVDVTVPVAVVGRSKGVVLGGKLAVYPGDGDGALPAPSHPGRHHGGCHGNEYR